MTIYPVILCGGAGTRLWPASRPSRPKQFASLAGARSLFELTALRASGIPGIGKLIVVTAEGQSNWVAQQLSRLHIEADVLLEPAARDSAPAMAAAAAHIATRDGAGIAAILASDHHITDDQRFAAAIITAAEAAAQGRIVTLGVHPTSPNTAYGYIRPGQSTSDGVRPVAAFVEKPDSATAQRYVADGYLWNSGNFVVSCRTLLSELEAHAPDVKASAEEAVATATMTPRGLLLGDSFADAPKISIDYAVMEKTNAASVLPVDFAWSDLGAWDALHDVQPKDASGNAVSGDSLLLDTRNSLVVTTTGMLSAVIGLDGVAVVTEPDCVLVCRMDSSQSVKTIVERLKSERRPQANLPRTTDAGALLRAPGAWLKTAIMPVWWTSGADPRWGFHESLDAEGRPTNEPRRCRVQARQVYAFATAGQMNWPGPVAQAIDHGLDALQTRYRRGDGLYRTLVGTDGTVLDERAMTYDQAFILLALASAAHLRPDAEALALDLLKALDDGRSMASGGYREEGDRFLSNPHMHLFEAAMAWIEAGGGPRWEKLATDLATLALERLFNAEGKFIREHFDADWHPASGEVGRIVEPGHQFEWAWLMARWARHASDNNAADVARQLYVTGRRGIDPLRGVAVNQLTDSFKIKDRQARFWVQTEWLTSAVLLLEMGADKEIEGLEQDIVASAAAVWRYIDADRPGLWRDKLQADDSFVDEPSPASSLYHLVAAVKQIDDSWDALSLARERKKGIARP